jgi:carboxylesterase type B
LKEQKQILILIQCRNPTPRTDDLIDTIWPKYTTEKEEYLSIDEKLRVKQHQEGLKIWHDLEKQFTGHM